MVNFFCKNKIPEISVYSETLDTESFKLISYMLAWDALKKVKNSLNKKVGLP